MKQFFRKRLHIFSLFVLVLSLILPLIAPAITQAASSGQFQSGRIMDDGFFFTSGTLSVSDIQNFLNSKVPVCDTNHTPSSNPNDSGPPYTCLKSYTQDIPAKPADAYCGGSIGAGTAISSAQIIYEVSRACNINAKVLIVLLQKEQSLVTDTWPWAIQYRSATGYGCPDTAACDSQYYGFFNQVYNAARQSQRYIKQPNLFNYRVGVTSFVAYNPNSGCGGSNITMQTQATAALYNYTPYQPNVAALNNLYGTGDGCSAYGNRNFWRLYNDWFGPTTSDSDAHTLGFVRLNHGSGQTEYIGTSSISSFSAISRNNLTAYPAVAPDGAVIPTFWPNGDLVFIRLNHASGRSELVSLGASGGFQQVVNYQLVGYPAVAPDGAVIPMFWPPNGDLVFIRLNHTSGRTELVLLSVGSNYQQIINYRLTAYPAVNPDGAVIPMFWPNGDLVLIRLNHSSGRVELVSLSASSGFQQVVNYRLVAYPAVAPDGAVVPIFNTRGDLSFVRLNHSSGQTEIATFSASSGFQQLVDYRLTAYPAISDFNAVNTLISR